MRGSQPTITREKSTKERDQWFLSRVLTSKRSQAEQELITRLVNRYHWDVFTDINFILHMDSALSIETLLDNHEYVLGKFRKITDRQFESAFAIYSAGSSQCLLRTAPVAVRRKAVALVALRSELIEMDDLPETVWSGDGSAVFLQLNSDYAELADKHSRSIPKLVELISLDPERTVGELDAIMTQGIALALVDGAL
jgi:hypothetical protein